MAAFLQKLVKKLTSGAGEVSPAVFVCGFGKHPGYTDHFEHMPEGSQHLPGLWELLYEQGIKSLVSVWRQMPPAERIEEFNHIFIWRNGNTILAGRMWSSSDGASPPRREFPLVVCAECQNLPLAWVLRSVLPELAGLETQCKSTESLAVVRNAIDSSQQRLQAALGETPSNDSAATSPEDSIKSLAANPRIGEQGLLRILYHLERDWNGRRGDLSPSSPKRTLLRPQQARVPAMHSPDQSIAAWMGLLTDMLTDDTSILMLVPLDRPWADILIGQPLPANFSCIRASTDGLPLTSNIPYQLDAGFLECYLPLIGASRGEKPIVKAAAEPSAAPSRPPPAPLPEPIKPAPTATVRVEPPAPAAPPANPAPVAPAAPPTPATPSDSASRQKLFIAGSGLAAIAIIGIVCYAIFSGGRGGNRIATTIPANPATQTVSRESVTSAQPDSSSLRPTSDDPRINWNAAATLQRIEAQSKALKERYSASLPPSLAADIAAAAGRVTQLKSLPWVRGNQVAIEQNLPAISSELDRIDKQLARIVRDEDSYAEWANDTRGQDRPFASAALNAVWTSRRDELLAAAIDKPSRRRGVEVLRSTLGRIDKDLKPDSPISAPATRWGKAISGLAAAQDEAAVGEAVKSIAADASIPDQTLAKIKSARARLREDAAALVADLARIELLLDNLYSLGEKNGDISLRSLYASAAANPISKAQSIADELTPLRRIERLLEIEKLDDRAKVLSAAAGPHSQELQCAFWRRLCALRPRQFSDLSQEARLTQAAERAVDGLADRDRRQALQAQLVSQRRELWRANYMLAASAAQIESAIASMPNFGVSEQRQLVAGLEYNILLCALRKEAAGPADASAMHKTVDAFIAEAVKLSVASNAQPAQLLKDLKVIRESAQAGASAPGPSSADWQRTTEGEVERYTWTSKSDRKHTIDFVKFELPDSTFYLCTQELPLGLLIDVIDARGDWRAFSGLLKPARPGDRCGAYVWDFNDPSNLAQGIKPADDWISLDDYYDRAHDVSPGKPSLVHPVQQINVPAAVYLCRLIGCRLPASAEWQEAYRRFCKTGQGQWNLRDRAWDIQFRYSVGRLNAGMLRQPPLEMQAAFGVNSDTQEQIDRALPWARSLQVGKAPAGPDDQYNDGILWFRPVSGDPASPMKDLVGNVAEIVCDDPEFWRTLAGQPADKIDTLLASRQRASTGKWAVIGGSALSPPTVPFDKPQVLSRPDRGYADVGLRLCFSAPAVPTAQQFAKAIQSAAYIPPK